MSKSTRVYNWLRAYIEEHKFSAVRKIPSENALSRKFDLSRETVREAIARLGEEGFVRRVRGSGTYINKDAAISSELDSGKAPRKIGMILQGQDRDANSSLIEGVKEVLPPDMVDLRIFLTDNKLANERRCLESVLSQCFSGFIVDGVKANLMNPNLDCYQQLYQRKIPVVFYNNYYKELSYPKVVVDNHACADQLLRTVIEAGHRKIVGIFFYDNHQSVEKYQGMIAAMRKYGVAFDDDFILWCGSDELREPYFFRKIVSFFHKAAHFTAVVCCNVMVLRLVRKIMAEAGKTIPGDCSLACFDYSMNDWEEAGIACSVHQGRLIGREVASILMRLIETGDFQDKGHSRILPPVIHQGNSVRGLNVSPPAR
jgi:GntR family transcriptional regulator of arabinose operon